MHILRCVVAVVFTLVGQQAVSANQWCGASDAENWREFASLFWAGNRSDTGRPIVYTLGAPWCPYCAQLYKSSSGQRYKVEFRFVPIDPRNERHRDQIADIAVDGTAAALNRTYNQRNAAPGPVSKAQRDFVYEVEEVVNQALFDRYSDQAKTWGSPTSFLMLDGKLIAFTGMPTLEKLESLANNMMPSPAHSTAHRFLKSGLPPERPLVVPAAARQNNVRLRILPDTTALAAFCIPRAGLGLKTSGIMTVDGVDWLVFKQNPPKTTHRIYGLASDFRR